jgi:RHS repeat-associated protein
VRCAYDAAHRLCEVQAGGGRVQFAHDPSDNLVSQPGLDGATFGPEHRIARANGADFEHNARGDVIGKRGPHGTVGYRYDARCQLVACTTPAGEWRASYDAIGRRTRTEFGAAWREYFWDSDRLAAELDSDGRLRVYVYADAFAAVPLLWLDYPDAEVPPESGVRHYALGDHLGRPLLVENDDGATVWRGTHAPYGRVAESDVSRAEVLLRFPGHYYDAPTGLHYNRFRYYDPTLGRYLQPDRLGTVGATNPYAYAANPLRQVDLRGDCETDGTAAPAKKSNEQGDEAEGEDGRPASTKNGRWLSDDELQGVADSVHAALEDPRAERSRTTCVTQGVDEDGNVVHTVTASQPLTEDQKVRAAEILGPGAVLQEGPRVGRLPENGHHAEQQGIAATQGQTDRRQTSSSEA